MTDLLMPKLGLTMDEGTVVRWLAREGEQVLQGQPLLEVQTDKVTVEVESPVTGMLGSLLVPEGGTVPIGALLASIGSEAVEREKPARVTPLARRIAAAESIDLSGAAGARVTPADARAMAARAENAFSSPRARKRAREAGIDWRAIVGSGPQGRVIERDVIAATPGAAQTTGEQTSAAQVIPAADFARMSAGSAKGDLSQERVRWLMPTAAQRLAAERTAAAFATAPHFYLTAEADAEALVELRKSLIGPVKRRAMARVTFTDLLLRALIVALAEHPLARGYWEESKIGVRQDIHVGIATATERGLLVPVLRDADRLSLSALAFERSRLVQATRSGRLAPDDLSDGVATLSNLGTHRVDKFQPVLNSPQSVILATGRIAPRPFAEAGQLLLRHTVFLTLACDHRVLDGEAAARFLDTLVRLVEEPFELLV